MGLKYYYKNRERLKEVAKKYAKNYYYKNKKEKLKKTKEWMNKNSEYIKKYKSNFKHRNYFSHRSTLIKNRNKIGLGMNHKEHATKLFWIWIKQKGRCAYTGTKLQFDSTTHLDHIIPVSKGGTNHPSNLQFVSSVANQAKSNLTHDEFILLCKNISQRF
jgi:CRISPR/Cas system Type II protein with McrA/HNH and RuvC-like nuclease domain